MQPSEKQRAYICYAIRASRLLDRLPQRLVAIKVREDTPMNVNHVWLDLDAWMVRALTVQSASKIIALFNDGDEEGALKVMADHGYPIISINS